MQSCGVVIPVYNSAQYLQELLSRISEIQQEISWELEILIVDDGSDMPLPVFKNPALEIKQIRHERNLGKGRALKTGFSYFVRNPAISAVLTLDADLQHPPVCIPAFLEKITSDKVDFVVGYRIRDPKIMPLHRILSNFLTSLVISGMIKRRILDSQCGFRLYSRKALELVKLQEKRFHLESEFLIRGGWQGLKFAQVVIPTIYNDAPSAIRHVRDTLNFIVLIFKLLKERMTGYV